MHNNIHISGLEIVNKDFSKVCNQMFSSMLYQSFEVQMQMSIDNVVLNVQKFPSIFCGF
jgi:hypothetical protein